MLAQLFFFSYKVNNIITIITLLFRVLNSYEQRVMIIKSGLADIYYIDYHQIMEYRTS